MKQAALQIVRQMPVRFPVMLGFLAVMLILLEVTIRQLSGGLDQRLYNSARLEETAKLGMEVDSLFHLAEGYVEGTSGHTKDEVQLALDLVWARAQTLKTRNYKAVMAEENTDLSLIDDFNRALPDFDRAVAMLEAGKSQTLVPMTALEIRFHERLGTLANQAWMVRQKKMIQLVSRNNRSLRLLRDLQTGFGIFALLGILYVIVELFLSRRTNQRLNEVLTEKQAMLWLDPLTGIGNRAFFEDNLTRWVNDGRQDFSLIYVDLDGFKQVNDSQGHASGDRLLVNVAAILKDLTTTNDVVARLGGDEFAILTREGLDGTRQMADAALSRIEQTVGDSAMAAFVSASFGIARRSDLSEGESADRLMRYADMALYAAKGDGKGCIRQFNLAILADFQSNVVLEQDMRGALDRDDLGVAFQPIVNLDSLQVVAAEALVRWVHPTLGPIAAERIVEIADRIDQTRALTRFMIRQAVRMQKELTGLGHDMRISVNLAPSLLGKAGIATEIIGWLDEAQAKPGTIALEVTENGPLAYGGIVEENLKTFRKAGMVMAIDDFGEAHSNINRLMQLDFRYLKLDRAVAANVGTSERAMSILTGISRMAETIGTHIICEGIETPEQMRLVRQAGITLAQGYLFSMPIGWQDFVNLVTRQTAGRSLSRGPRSIKAVTAN